VGLAVSTCYSDSDGDTDAIYLESETTVLTPGGGTDVLTPFERYFTTDPGLITGESKGSYAQSDAPYYQWDAANGWLHIEQPNKNVDGQDHYAYLPITYWCGSFTLEFDLQVIQQPFDGALSIILKGDPASSSQSGEPLIQIFFGQDGGGKVVGMRAEDILGTNQVFISQPLAADDGVWRKYELTVGPHQVVLVSTNPDGSQFFRFSMPYKGIPPLTGVLGIGATSSLNYLTFSDNRDGSFPGSASTDPAIGNIDNIRVHSCEPKRRYDEAIVNLAGIYKAQAAYFGVYNTFAGGIDCFNLLYQRVGWDLEEPKNRYTYHCDIDSIPPANPLAPPTSCTVLFPVSAQFGFTACASGNIDSDMTLDEWDVNDAKRMLRVINDDRQ